MTIGWIGNVLILTGAWRLARRRRSALLFGISGDMFWIIEAFNKGMWDLLFIEAALLLFGVRNYIKWGRSDARSTLDAHQ
jgi:hypothetical protein